MYFPYLSAILFLPALGALIIALWPNPTTRGPRNTALVFALAAFALSIVVFLLYDKTSFFMGKMQFAERALWIPPPLNAYYYLGVDGLSLPMVILTTLIGVIAVLVSWRINLRPKEYFAWLLLLETGILGVFMSLDLVLFFLFWEVELIPMFMLISVWGSGRKEYSATKFVLYTLLGSALMLTGILLLYFNVANAPFMAGKSPFDMVALSQANLAARGITLLPVIFLLILMAFVIKLPVFPFHTWLPDAHTDAPTAVSVVLAGVLLKMGGYGMIRIGVGIFPEAARMFAPLFVVLAVVNTLYGAAITMRQTDLKRMIAYSSVSHMGYVLLGIFALTQISLTGATLQMFSHGIVTGLLFSMVGLVYEKTHTRDLNKLGGLARQMPVALVVFSIAGLASLGLPATSGFIAEFTVFLGSFTSKAFDGIQPLTILAVVGIALTAGYILWMLQRVFYGPPRDEYAHVPDAQPIEMVPIFALVVAIVLVGIFPSLLTDIIRIGVQPVMRAVGL
ncbi:MAG: NADH-quinone oxidoreductase subunit M [Chloroflexi bacterium]|nr:NADH-quinone oxidoreductase subunit M [Chloroflexota bacterium]